MRISTLVIALVSILVLGAGTAQAQSSAARTGSSAQSMRSATSTINRATRRTIRHSYRSRAEKLRAASDRRTKKKKRAR